MKRVTRPVAAKHVARIENLVPDHCRSIRCLHGETDADPVRYEADKSEIKYIWRAIRIARQEG
jgi:hypothetical protein